MREVAKLSVSVEAFANEMESKLLSKRGEGWSGWDDPAMKVELIGGLERHVEALKAGDSRQAIDVANFAMFLWLLDA